MYKRGMVYNAQLNGKGSVQKGYRPVIIVSNDDNNTYSPNVNVCAVSKVNKNRSWHVPIESTNLDFKSYVLVEQIYTLPKKVLKEYLGQVIDKEMFEVNKAIIGQIGGIYGKI